MKTSKLPILIAIILIGIAPMADTYILIPAMSDIAAALPDASPFMISFILTISSLFVIPSSLIAGKLVGDNKLSKKSALLIGFVFFTIGGAAGGLIPNIYYILFTRAIEGIGNGFAMAMIVTVTADYFHGKERANVMGMYSAISSLIAIGFTLLGGYLTLINWRYAFAAYLLCAPIIIYHAIVLKKNPPKSAEALAEEEAERKAMAETGYVGQKPRLGKAVWILIMITLVSQILGNTLYLTLSLFIEGEKIGNAASTGYANSILTVAIVIISLVFGQIYSNFKKYTAVLFMALMAIGYLLLANAFSFGMVSVALIVWGLGFGLTIAYLYQEATIAPPKVLITFCGALVNSIIFFSYVLSTFVPTLVASVFNNQSIRFLFVVIGMVLFACAVIIAIYYMINKKENVLE